MSCDALNKLNEEGVTGSCLNEKAPLGDSGTTFKVCRDFIKQPEKEEGELKKKCEDGEEFKVGVWSDDKCDTASASASCSKSEGDAEFVIYIYNSDLNEILSKGDGMCGGGEYKELIAMTAEDTLTTSAVVKVMGPAAAFVDYKCVEFKEITQTMLDMVKKNYPADSEQMTITWKDEDCTTDGVTYSCKDAKNDGGFMESNYFYNDLDADDVTKEEGECKGTWAKAE